MTTRIDFTRTQWAVGQGFFHSGEVSCLDARALYVYDCGSLSSNSLDRELDEFIDRYSDRVVDLVFVSHYHYDHVSGLPKLLKDAKVRAVVIPVLSPAERLVAAAVTTPASDVTGWTMFFAADPEGALQEVAPDIEIIRVFPEGEDGADGDDDDDPDFDHVDVGVGGGEKLTAPTQVSLRIGKRSVLQGTDASGATVKLWEWRGYTTKFAYGREKKLLEKLAKQSGLDESKVEAALADPAQFRSFVETFHTQITQAFAESFADVNLSSLLVYSGPADERPVSGLVYRTRTGEVEGREIGAWDIRPGWFGTGDQKMGVRRCKEVAKEFESELHRVGVLALPHHGASSSYHPALIKMFPGQKPTCVAAAGENSPYGHPEREVLSNVASQGSPIVIVTEDVRSRITESGAVDF
ncbi:MBL fold metallo-hydrolase [Microbacterium sp. 22215]|uniref:MBL fold metallo-hydrolase n=1 Tax=Microbacterium sp. 22215 TaxID=3453893 RepID=UPI003F825002